MNHIKEKLRYDERTARLKSSLKKLKPEGMNSSSSNSECIPVAEEVENLSACYMSLNSTFPLNWQHRHSRFLCRMYDWSFDPSLGFDAELLFLNTPTQFAEVSQSISVILDEFLIELKQSQPNLIDRSKYTFLIERFPKDEMNICGPIQVIFKPVKIVRTFILISLYNTNLFL